MSKTYFTLSMMMVFYTIFKDIEHEEVFFLVVLVSSHIYTYI
jgi:hypothetical protein